MAMDIDRTCPNRPDPKNFGEFVGDGDAIFVRNVTIQRGTVAGSHRVLVKSVSDLDTGTLKEETRIYQNCIKLDEVPGVLRHYAHFKESGQNHFMYCVYDKPFAKYMTDGPNLVDEEDPVAVAAVPDDDDAAAPEEWIQVKPKKQKGKKGGTAPSQPAPPPNMSVAGQIPCDFLKITRSLVSTLRNCHNKNITHGNINLSTIVFVGKNPLLRDFTGDVKPKTAAFLKDYEQLANTLRDAYHLKHGASDLPEELKLFLKFLKEEVTSKMDLTNVEFYPIFLGPEERFDYAVMAFYSYRFMWRVDPEVRDPARRQFRKKLMAFKFPVRNGVASWTVPAKQNKVLLDVFKHKYEDDKEDGDKYGEDAISFLRFWKNTGSHVEKDLRANKVLASSVLQSLWPEFLFDLHKALIYVKKYICIEHRTPC